MTLDGVFYTFNGVGEYVLVRSKLNEIKFQFQGRTTAIRNSNATVFSAFAIEDNDTNVQVLNKHVYSYLNVLCFLCLCLYNHSNNYACSKL